MPGCSTETHNNRRAATQAFLRETPFVGIRLYAKDPDLRYQTWISPEVAQQLTTETHQHTFPVASEHHHNKFRDASGNLHIQVVIPLMDNQQEIYGFFEGVSRWPGNHGGDHRARARRCCLF